MLVGGGEDEVAAGGPSVGAVTQSDAGKRVVVFGEAGTFAQGSEPAADLVGQVGEAAAAQPVFDEYRGRGPDRPAPTVRRTLFRVVQESLTNVHKHAPGADANVSVHYGRNSVRATVSNTAPRRPPDTDITTVGGGTGLDGLRHRVEVVGGTLTAGSTSDGGFTVSATLPVYVPTAVRR